MKKIKRLEIDRLIERFWKGETSLEEEKGLKENAGGVYFQFLKEKQKAKISSDFDKRILSKIEGKPKGLLGRRMHYYLVAASLTLILGFFAIKQRQDQKKIEALLAYEQTKAALLLVSTKLNEGAEYTTELNKINEVKKIISTN
ncbi:MAG: hypothetical protein AAF363_21880 [Bacteroidota bacterium]